MGLISTDGKYIKIKEMTFFTIIYQIYKNKEVRKTFDKEFDIIQEVELKIPEDIFNVKTIPNISLKNNFKKVCYKYLKEQLNGSKDDL